MPQLFELTGGKFDHDKTNFKLTGAHETVTCNACHIAGHYKQTPKSCNGCHATDDEHRGARGEDCEKCHVTKEWRTAKYDHLKRRATNCWACTTASTASPAIGAATTG